MKLWMKVLAIILVVGSAITFYFFIPKTVVVEKTNDNDSPNPKPTYTTKSNNYIDKNYKTTITTIPSNGNFQQQNNEIVKKEISTQSSLQKNEETTKFSDQLKLIWNTKDRQGFIKFENDLINLAKSGQQDVVVAITNAIIETDGVLQNHLINLLSKIGTPLALEKLISLSSIDNDETRVNVLRAIAEGDYKFAKDNGYNLLPLLEENLNQAVTKKDHNLTLALAKGSVKIADIDFVEKLFKLAMNSPDEITSTVLTNALI